MPLETATHISDLVVTNPANSDGLNQADDHMRLIKGVLLTDIGDAMTSKSLTVPDGTSAAPTIGFKADATAGLYRKSTGNTGIVGRLSGNGAVAVGELCMFLVEPTGLGKGGTGTGYQYLELDGSTWPNSAFPDLATHLGQGGTTFTLPNAYATGRFPRSRTASVTAGSVQSNTVGPHTHPDVTATTAAETQSHTHTFSGNTGGQSNTHTHLYDNRAGGDLDAGGGPPGGDANPNGAHTGPNEQDHTHAFSGTTSDRSATHNHTVTVSTPANTGTTETRPEALAVVLCIKT